MKILENYHCYITFLILCEQKYNILANISENKFRFMRKNIIHNILATDMKKHF